jgi:NADH dehydrogenase
MNSILITGSSGFVGRNLLARLDLSKYANVYCLSRSETKLAPNFSQSANLTFIRGSLFDPTVYHRYLSSTDCVIHLAAATGKARPEEHFHVNVEGTRLLLEQCRRLQVSRFLHISSIAVRFPDKSRYYYAQSKELAEQIVRSSGLRYTILRPTIIVGPGAPAWAGLVKLAGLPVIPVFGDGKTLLQPIHIDDLLDFIFSILDSDLFDCQTLDLGGPQAIAIEELLRKIRLLLYRSQPRTVHIPLALVIPFLSLLETWFYSLLPVTVGQLASFRSDGTIQKNRLFEERCHRLKTIDDMLGACPPQGGEPIHMTLVESNRLERECRVFAAYLASPEPGDYILEKYRDAHRKTRSFAASGPFDRFLLSFAKANPALTPLADSYACLLARGSALRKKLILLLAILECCPPEHGFVDSVDAGGKALLYLRSLQKGLLFALRFFLAALLLVPFHIVLALAGRISKRNPSP